MRYIFTMSDEMYEDLTELAEKKRMSLAELVRGYIADALVKETGRDIVEYRVLHGGDRTKSEE